MIVVDASAMIESILHTPAAPAVERWLLDSAHTLHVPHLLDMEVAQVIRRFVATRQLDAEAGRQALVRLVDYPVQRYPHGALLPRIWSLRDNLTAYDAAYVALAELLDAPLITRDRRLAAAAGHTATVHLV